MIGLSETQTVLDAVILNGWSFDASVWQGFVESMGIGEHVVCLNAHDEIFTTDAWMAAIAAKLDSRSHVYGWSLGGIRAIELAGFLEANALPVGSINVLMAGPVFSEKPDCKMGICQDEFTAFSALVREPDRLCREFPLLITKGALGQRQDLRQVKSVYQSSMLPSENLLRAGLDALENADLRCATTRLTTPLHFVLGERDKFFDKRTSVWLEEHASQHYVSMLADCGHFPFGVHLDQLVGVLNAGRQERQYV